MYQRIEIVKLARIKMSKRKLAVKVFFTILLTVVIIFDFHSEYRVEYSLESEDLVYTDIERSVVNLVSNIEYVKHKKEEKRLLTESGPIALIDEYSEVEYNDMNFVQTGEPDIMNDICPIVEDIMNEAEEPGEDFMNTF